MHVGQGLLFDSGDQLYVGLEGQGPDHRGDTIDEIELRTSLGEVTEVLAPNSLVLALHLGRVVEGLPTESDDDQLQARARIIFAEPDFDPAVPDPTEDHIALDAIWRVADGAGSSFAVLDLAGRLGFRVFGLGAFVEGEAWYGTGYTSRGFATSSGLTDLLRELAIDGATAGLTSTGATGDLSDRSAQIVDLGASNPAEREAVEPALIASLHQNGRLMFIDDAATLSDRILTRGLADLLRKRIDVEFSGGRGVFGLDWSNDVQVMAEVGAASGVAVNGASGAPLLAFGDEIGVAAGTQSSAVVGALLGDAFLGSRIAAVGWDSNYDPALLLFDQVGPVNPSHRTPQRQRRRLRPPRRPLADRPQLDRLRSRPLVEPPHPRRRPSSSAAWEPLGVRRRGTRSASRSIESPPRSSSGPRSISA